MVSYKHTKNMTKSIKRMKEDYPRRWFESKEKWEERLRRKREAEQNAYIFLKIIQLWLFKITPVGAIGYMIFG